MTRTTPTANKQTTTGRWLRLSEDLARLATDPDFDGARKRVAYLVVVEALALGASTEIREVPP
ncbi:MAG: hypothetical protein AAGH92_07335 [Planctomycetota bacterium]